MLMKKINVKLVVTIFVMLVMLFVTAVPVSAASSKTVRNGLAFNVSTSYITGKTAKLTITANWGINSSWDRTNGGDIYSAVIVVSDWQKNTAKKYTYRSSVDGGSKVISLPNKAFKSNRYTVTVAWSNTPVLNQEQRYKAKIANGSFS